VVEVVVVVLVVVFVHPWPRTVKLPWSPMPLSWTAEVPVLFTWTTTIVVFPDAESAMRLAVTWPFEP